MWFPIFSNISSAKRFSFKEKFLKYFIQSFSLHLHTQRNQRWSMDKAFATPGVMIKEAASMREHAFLLHPDLITRYKEQQSSAYQPGLHSYPPKQDLRVPLSILPPFLLHKSYNKSAIHCKNINIAASEKQGGN